MKSALLGLFATGFLLMTSAPFAMADDRVTVRPEPSDEILANPGMGWETFHHPARQDRTLPAWIPSTVEYVRWGWRDVEPRPGEIDTGLIDRTLELARASGQKLAFRVMCCSTTRNAPYHPGWLKDVGGKELLATYDGAQLPIPDLDDPVTIQKHLDLIARLGARYDGHPDVDHVDLGSVGWWGEWHLSGGEGNRMPTSETCQRIIDAYRAAFRKTPLLMLIGGGDRLAYAVKQGTGWRADCLGDLGGFGKNWCHMRKGYPEMFRKGGLDDAWRHAPVAWETCWDMRKWVQEGWSLRYIFNYALALHGSVINNKSAPLPAGDEVRPELERFLRRLGYRLVLTELEHPATARPGSPLDLRMSWHNEGSAPCYRPYHLAYRLTDGSGASRVVTSELTASRWLPGTVDVFTEEFLKAPPDLPAGPTETLTDRVALPADLAPGSYGLSVGIVDDSQHPVVRLGIKGRADDGWYPLSRLQIAP